MINIIKNKNGNQVKDPEERYIVEMTDGSMIEVRSFREATAAVVGMEYVDCETAETEWHMRLDAAKSIGLMTLANEEDINAVVYDERIGKIPYSYTDANPDYEIPADPELIRIECDETFILSLAKMRYIRVWEKTNKEYEDYLKIRDIDQEIISNLVQFKDKMQNIPLHERV